METRISTGLKEAVRQAAQKLSPQTPHVDLADPFRNFYLTTEEDDDKIFTPLWFV